jgi:hypothetical protein
MTCKDKSQPLCSYCWDGAIEIHSNHMNREAGFCLCKSLNCWDGATEFHPNSMNREAGCYICKSWKPPICSLKKLSEMTSHPLGHMGHTQSEASVLRLLGLCSLSSLGP